MRGVWEIAVFDNDFVGFGVRLTFVDVDRRLSFAFGISSVGTFIGSDEVRVRLADFACLGAGPFCRSRHFRSPERRDSRSRDL